MADPTITPVNGQAGFFYDEAVNPAAVTDLLSAIAAAEAAVGGINGAGSASATAAAASATAAALSATNAAGSASSAATSLAGIGSSVTGAASSATAAASSATTAGTAATTATTQASNAATSASAAGTSATSAATSATAAANSASAGATSATAAAGSATTALTAAASAASSASSAALSASQAALSAAAALAAPGPIGSVTSNTGVFTSLACSTLTVGNLIIDNSTIGIEGTSTNDKVQAGSIGEWLELDIGGVTKTSVVTMTIAAPVIVSWVSHALAAGSPVYFTTTGALPTGLSASTTYYVTAGPNLANSSFSVSTTLANAFAGTSITTTGSQSGTHTCVNACLAPTTTAVDIGGMLLNAGDYEVWGSQGTANGGAATVSAVASWVSLTSATYPTLPPAMAGAQQTGTISTTGAFQLPTGRIRVSFYTPTLVVLSARYTTTATVPCLGVMFARRMR